MKLTSRIAHAFLIGGGALIAACTSANTASTGTTTGAIGCPEFDGRTTFDGSVSVDAKVRAFMEASANMKVVGDKLKVAAKTACVNIAHDLGAQDTWSMRGDSDDAISNDQHTGACDAAFDRIEAIMNGAGGDATFALEISSGACHEDFDAEASCEAGCSAQVTCDPGTVVTRCDPAQLSVQCQETCKANATCEGHESNHCNCKGKCEARCEGSCSGTCIDDDGRRTDNDDDCHGKCKGTCSGKCSGSCVIEESEGIDCGASVSCKGGCTGTFTEPKCETDFTPPSCMLDASCFESCRAKVAATTVCDPPTVKLVASANASGDVTKLVATIDANLPIIVDAAEGQGKIAADAVARLVSSGSAVVQNAGDLDRHSLACATAAASTATSASASLSVSAQASAKITSSCRSHAD